MKGTKLELRKGRVDVWFADLDRLAPRLGDAEALLSPEEETRVRRFRFPRDRTRYVMQRGTLRMLLGQYAARDPSELDIRCGTNGKPYLAGERNEFLFQFSMSASDELWAFAFCPGEPLGVDIEKIRDLPEMHDIVSQHFTARERHEFLSCPEDRRLPLFYRFWTRKEAVLKAQGDGLLIPLDAVEVARAVDDAGPWRIAVQAPSGMRQFSVADVEGPSGFSTSVATDGQITEIAIYRFIPSEGMHRG